MGLEPRTQTSRIRGKPLEPPGRYLNKGSGENDVYAARVQLDAGSLQSISKPKYDARASNRQTMPVTQACFSSFCGTFSGPTAPVAQLLAQVSLALNKYRGGVCFCHSTIPTYYPLLIIIVRPPMSTSTIHFYHARPFQMYISQFLRISEDPGTDVRRNIQEHAAVGLSSTRYGGTRLPRAD